MILTDIDGYDGHLLHQRFAYRYFRDKVSPLGNMIAFRGWMKVEGDAMIDQEDVLKEAFIYAEDAINFLWEIPQLDPFGAVAFQRLLNTRMGYILQTQYNQPAVEMRGDDIYVGEGKASVSITHVKQNAALGHTGINIKAGIKAPPFAYSTALTNIQVENFMQDVVTEFYHLCHSIFIATTKILDK